MCYMSRRDNSVGIRELRHNLSIYLRRVLDGETLQVTDRGRAVAILAPLPEAASPLQRLVLSGRASAPAGDLLKLGPPRARRPSTRVSKALQQLRSERL